ncbi:GNAT family N-acetyltransferase [Paenibacillus gallinarum]|uniref:GNAT family N-acetyltransferase n=1 Tax=Paenibacillus gallinarum TaxID=2762232 RepID=A0ABR8SWC4_9BACL|nr:GNAT family protein [Paenibacillus gallinarum]MBD7967394.1 GNAT family N-acetyltransferase [Paenibacillus gallinarum]
MIRMITPQDAGALLRLNNQLDDETKFMLFEPGERKTTVEMQGKAISSMLGSGHSTIIVAEQNGTLVGQITIVGSSLARKKHSAYIVIGIKQEYTGEGLGSKLFSAMENWCKEKGVHRLELTVMKHNTAALRLYEKSGFRIEGSKMHSLFIDGEYIDEYCMAKYL